jgi:hypothetical protein
MSKNILVSLNDPEEIRKHTNVRQTDGKKSKEVLC